MAVCAGIDQLISRGCWRYAGESRPAAVEVLPVSRSTTIELAASAHISDPRHSARTSSLATGGRSRRPVRPWRPSTVLNTREPVLSPDEYDGWPRPRAMWWAQHPKSSAERSRRLANPGRKQRRIRRRCNEHLIRKFGSVMDRPELAATSRQGAMGIELEAAQGFAADPGRRAIAVHRKHASSVGCDWSVLQLSDGTWASSTCGCSTCNWRPSSPMRPSTRSTCEASPPVKANTGFAVR